MKRGYIIEDHISAQKWLRDALLQAYPEIDVVVASTLKQGYELLNHAYPDIALIDLNLPDGSGIDIISRISRDAPDTISVVTTIYDDDDHLFPALSAGARGYVLKEQRKDDICRLLQGIVRGEPPLSPAISQRLISYFSRDTLSMAGEEALTSREKEVLSFIAQGNSLKEVAGMLGISRNTVATQVKSIYGKLNISSRAEAALAAAKMGVLHTP